MKLIELLNIFKNTNGIPKIENNGVLSSLPPELLQLIVSHLDLKSVLNVRALSKEHLEKIHYFLSNPVLGKKIGLINLDQMDLTAVGENVMHRTFGISDFYGKPKEPRSKEIKKSFQNKVSLFKNPEDADAHIKKHSKKTEFDELESKPHQAIVTLKNPNTLFRILKTTGKEKDLVLTVRDNEITEKITFK
ncbi:TPA: F-box protein [Legionella anisa]|nr:F-box protein [Legionella anisa]MBN5937499.1 F-box protein [Legionella anisa]MCW8447685.1 F-box protein [Legionella anisa]